MLGYLEGEPEKTATHAVASPGLYIVHSCYAAQLRLLLLGAMYHIHYHNSSSLLPHNFVALGDAVIKLNLAFGYATRSSRLSLCSPLIADALPCRQGLTKAMISAIVLNSTLVRTAGETIRPGFAAQFFRAHKAKSGSSWCALVSRY